MPPTSFWPDLAAQAGLASLQAAVLALLVIVSQRVFGRWLSPAWRHALWLLVLARLTIPYAPPSPWSWEDLARRALDRMTHPAGAVVHRSADPAAVRQVDSRLPSRADPAPSTVTPPLDSGPARPTDLAPLTAPAPDAARTGSRWLSWMVNLWLAGAILLLIRLMVANGRFGFRVRRWPEVTDPRLRKLAEECRRRMSLHTHVALRESPEVSSPCLFGLWRPSLLLPPGLAARLTASELGHVLLHEFGHVKRRDLLVHAWFSVVTCLHWFNPLAWFAASRCRRDRELACDALVLESLGEEEASAYGSTVLKLVVPTAAILSPATAVGIVENHRELKQRLSMIGSFGRHRGSTSLAVGVLAFLGLCCWTGSSDETAEAWPLDLSAHCDFPNYQLPDDGRRSPDDAPGTWYQAPKGRQEFFGVPFSVRGLIRLSGERVQRDGWSFRPRTGEIPVNRRFGRIHLLHATYYNGPEDTPVARVWFNYADGRREKLEILFGYHVRNWHRHKHEYPVNLRDLDSRVAWTGDNPNLAAYGKSVRICLTSLRNPRPASEVRSLELESANHGPSEVIFGITLGGRDLPGAWTRDLRSPEPEEPPRERFAFRALDARTERPVPGLRLDFEAAQERSHFYLGHATTDAEGRAELRYPAGDFTYFDLWVTGDGYVPKIVHWETKECGPLSPDYLYRAEPGRRIGGRISDPAGLPVRDAVIEIQGPGIRIEDGVKEALALTRARIVSDAEGRWDYRGLPSASDAPLPLRVTVSHPDFQTTQVPDDALADPDANSLVRMVPGREIRGFLKDESGGTPRGTVHLTGPLDAPPVVTMVTRTEADGRFRFRNVPPRIPLALIVQADGYAPAIHVLPLQDDDAETEIRLGRGPTIHGTVLDRDSQPVAGAQLTVENWEGRVPLPNSVTTDPQGEFAWSNTPDGPVSFQVTHPDFLPAGVVWVPSRPGPLVARLTRPVRFSGTVVSAASRLPIVHGRIFADDSDRPDPDPGTPWAVIHGGRFSLALDPATDSRAFRIEAYGHLPARLTVNPGVVEQDLHIELKTTPAD